MAIVDSVLGSITLVKPGAKVNQPDRLFEIEIIERTENGLIVSRSLMAEFGVKGGRTSVVPLGDHSYDLLHSTVVSHLKRGYEITHVNSVAFTGADTSRAICIAIGQYRTPAPTIHAVDVEVTFDVGQCAPVW